MQRSESESESEINDFWNIAVACTLLSAVLLVVTVHVTIKHYSYFTYLLLLVRLRVLLDDGTVARVYSS
jgi:hypothetical protein